VELQGNLKGDNTMKRYMAILIGILAISLVVAGGFSMLKDVGFEKKSKMPEKYGGVITLKCDGKMMMANLTEPDGKIDLNDLEGATRKVCPIGKITDIYNWDGNKFKKDEKNKIIVKKASQIK